MKELKSEEKSFEERTKYIPPSLQTMINCNMKINPEIRFSKYYLLYLEDVLFIMRFSKLSYKELLKIFQNDEYVKMIYVDIHKQKTYFDMDKLMNYTGEILP